MAISDLEKETNSEKKQEVILQKGPLQKEAFTEDQLKMSWIEFAHKAKENNLHTLYTAMTSADPTFSTDFKLHFSVKNTVQLDFLSTHKSDIVNFLRTQLKNDLIQLEVKEDSKIEDREIYTSEGKYRDMVARNPNLEELRKRFHLDIDL